MPHILRVRIATDGSESRVELDGRDITDAVQRVAFEFTPEGTVVSHLVLWADVELDGEAACVTAALIAEDATPPAPLYTVGPGFASERAARGGVRARPGAEVFESFEAAFAYLVRSGLARKQRVYRLDAEAEHTERRPGEPFRRLTAAAPIEII